MGTWGSGNFDSDAARDVLEEVLEVLDIEIDGFTRSDRVGIEDLQAILACIAIKLEFIDRCDVQPPSAQAATALRDKVLAIYDAEIEGFQRRKGFAEERHAVMVETLGRLVRVAEPGVS